MNPRQLVFCHSNPTKTDLVEVTVIEGDRILTGNIGLGKLMGWLQENATFNEGVGAGGIRKTA
jgi:hypothetical protein